MDVTVDGQVLWMGGSTGAKWVSFSGLTFAPGGLGRITLPLLNGQLVEKTPRKTNEG